MQVCNYVYDINSIKKDDIFVCVIGFEERSLYFLKKIISFSTIPNILALTFSDLNKKKVNVGIINDLKSYKAVVKECSYEQGYDVAKVIMDYLDEYSLPKSDVIIDYSSMPRTWYSTLPYELNNKYDNDFYYLYDVGEYPYDYKTYPSAGIKSYSQLGRTSLRDNKRMHIIGIGYDSVRTEALLSILNPDMYMVCSAHCSTDMEMEKKVREVNKRILDQAVSCTELFTDDFSFMLSRLCEIANEYLPLGDVIFVPDGPKPLIMAMSLVPQLLRKEGIVCMHISRNSEGYTIPKVSPTENVICFKVY